MCIKAITDWFKSLFNPPVEPPPPPPPPPPLIQYLVIAEDERAPVWPIIDAQVTVLGYMKDGDMAAVRERIMQGEQLWVDVLVGDLRQFEPGTTGWVKFRDEKMWTEWR